MNINDVVEIDQWHETYRYYGRFGPFTVLEINEKIEKNDKTVSDETKANFKAFGPHFIAIPKKTPNAKLMLFKRELKSEVAS